MGEGLVPRRKPYIRDCTRRLDRVIACTHDVEAHHVASEDDARGCQREEVAER